MMQVFCFFGANPNYETNMWGIADGRNYKTKYDKHKNHGA